MSPEAFELRVGALPARELTVLSLRGQEAMSRLFRFDVVVRTETDLLAHEPTLIGEPATLTMSVADEGSRVVRGIVSALESQGALPHGERRFVVRVRPRMALLRRRRSSRIFQDLTLVDIVNRVLDEHQVRRRWQLVGTHRERGYCVQYRETDYDFVTRLCAEVGVFFFFESIPATAGDETGPDQLDAEVVFCDAAAHYPPMAGGDPAQDGVVRPAPSLAVHAAGALSHGEAIHEFAYRRSIRSKSVALRDYDFERPLLELAASVGIGARSVGTPALLAAAPTLGRLEMYEHHGEYAETEVSHSHAETQLEQYRARAMIARGTSTCRRLEPGHRFHLEESQQPEMDGEYAVVRVTHEAIDPAEASRRQAAGPLQRYSNRFECVPAAVVYRPKRPRRDLTQVLESAVVVGPSGQEIYTDSYGRIKVQFHWDREGAKNELSSCWMRVMQPWAGASWGSQFIPRIGMEVLVSFLGGDEDRPVVLGSVYNATHQPPFILPQGSTRSGIRTQSVGGQGSNELSFEDAAGAELIYLNAQRDLQEQVRRDYNVHIGGDQRVQVAKSQRVEVEGERHDHVAGVETRSVGGAQLLTVTGELRQSIGGRKTETITESLNVQAHGVAMHNSGNHTETIQGYCAVSVGSDERPTGRTVTVCGPASWDATKSLTISSDTRIALECGDSSLTIGPEGIRIASKNVVVRARERLTLLGDGPGIELSKEADILADTINLFSKGGSVELDAEAAHMDGPLVKLNCGAGETPEIEDEPQRPNKKQFQWRCLDANKRPYEQKTYRLVTQGFKSRGVTDSDGVIEEGIPEDAFLAHVTLWLEEYPQGERLNYTIQLGDLPPTPTAYGALIRLRNLGYYAGPDSEEMTVELQTALVELQHDHGIPMSGELDDETVDKLDEIHPA